jgi:hypothetical protein
LISFEIGARVWVVYVPNQTRYTGTVIPSRPGDPDLYVRIDDTPPDILYFKRGALANRSETYRIDLEPTPPDAVVEVEVEVKRTAPPGAQPNFLERLRGR